MKQREVALRFTKAPILYLEAAVLLQQVANSPSRKRDGDRWILLQK